MKVKYIGPTFGGGYTGLTNGKIYECLGTEYWFLRVIDDEGEDYLYPAFAPGPLYDANIQGKWEVIEDSEDGQIETLIRTEQGSKDYIR